MAAGHHLGSGGKQCQLTEVEAIKLAATIISFVSENYVGATIDRAGKANNGGYILHVKKPMLGAWHSRSS